MIVVEWRITISYCRNNKNITKTNTDGAKHKRIEKAVPVAHKYNERLLPNLQYFSGNRPSTSHPAV